MVEDKMMSIKSLIACYCALKAKVADIEAALGDIDTSCDNNDYPVYRMSQPSAGVNVRRWTAAPDAVPHGNVDAIWTGPTDPLNGFPTHPNTPTQDIVEANWNYAGPDDQMEAWAWIELTQPTWLRDNNGNTGERGEVWIAECCGTPRLLQKTTVNTPSSDRNLLDPVLIPAGIHMLYVRQSDQSANQGFDLEASANGTTGWANFNGPTYATKPEVECLIVDGCSPVPEGYDLCYPEQCNTISPPPADSGLSEDDVIALIPAPVLPATAVANLESDNNESEGSWNRAGNVGTSVLYAREDHQHPIVRLPNPGDPVITHTGSGDMTQSLILDRESDEESYAYKFRTRVVQIPGNNWDFLTIPTIAGFQQPEIYGVGTYRTTSNTPQTDDVSGNGNVGAAPRGPYMGKEAHEWSSTRRIYLGFFRRDNTYTIFVEFWVRYTRS